ncbi:MAG: META domain-containing protein, partial [Victivallaceae bacterium]
MSTPNLILLGSTLLSTVLLGGCCGNCIADEENKTAPEIASSNTIAATKINHPLMGREWILVNESLPGFDKNWAKAENPISIKFLENGSAVGSGSVNRYNTKFSPSEAANNSSLKFSPIASTRMMGPSLKLEMLYFNTLAKVTAFKLEGNKLMMYNGDQMVAEFAPAKAAAVTPAIDGIKKVVWVLDLSSLDGVNKDWVKPAEAITLTIDESGKVTGCAGVNRYFGNPQLDEK